eukprot:TRINITY_DN11643_c0_g1_i1.p1 TRINITY_DN11643_c0_g1~~TRINITY_DN11643_c0_g1_i1.p1  ORF type:complete len:492 (+),score=138.00 TRINITY_DN11643_c0_g1_i1:96-1571(+)
MAMQVEAASHGPSSLHEGILDGSPWECGRSNPDSGLPLTPAYGVNVGSLSASLQGSSHLDPMSMYRQQLRRDARDEETAMALREETDDMAAQDEEERQKREELDLEADCARRLAMFTSASSPGRRSESNYATSMFRSRPIGEAGGSFASATAAAFLFGTTPSADGAHKVHRRGSLKDRESLRSSLLLPTPPRPSSKDEERSVGGRSAPTRPALVSEKAPKAVAAAPATPLVPALQLLKPTSQQRKLMTIVRRQLLPNWLPDVHLLRALLARHPDDLTGVVELCDAFRSVCDQHGVGCLQLADIESTFATKAFYWLPEACLSDAHLTLFFDGARYKAGRADCIFSDLTDMPRLVLSVLECMAHHHPVALARHGINIVLDFAGLSASDVSTFQKLLSLINTNYPVKILSVIILNASTWVSAWWSTKAPFVSTLPPSSSVHHLKSASMLKDSGLLRPESIPIEYGGPLSVDSTVLMDMMRVYLEQTDLNPAATR